MFWNRQRGRVYVYSYKDGKQKALPRDKVKHLDGQPDHNVEAWVKQYQEQFEGKKYTLDRFLTDKQLNQLVMQFVDYLKSRNKSKETIWMHKYRLQNHILQFFLEEPSLPDPNKWPSKSIKLLSFLSNRKLSNNYILKCNSSLRLFWRWLSEEGHIVTPYQLRLRNPVSESVETPLKYTLSPDEVLQYARTQPNPDLKFLALAGFFFSLRTFEVFGLQKNDFRAGKAVQSLECSKVMAKYNLFQNLVVNISRQRRRDGTYFSPKNDSKGWVACFNKQAAEMIVEIIKSKQAEEPILQFKGDWYLHLWSREGIKGITLKDLRRASLYWLGHHTTFELIPLRNHARHKRAETTLLYLRRPSEDFENNTSLDLEA